MHNTHHLSFFYEQCASSEFLITVNRNNERIIGQICWENCVEIRNRIIGHFFGIIGSALAPGPDGITYDVWKSNKNAPNLLATVYSICTTHKRISASWKLSNTVLIHKKGDPMCPNNWQLPQYPYSRLYTRSMWQY